MVIHLLSLQPCCIISVCTMEELCNTLCKRGGLNFAADDECNAVKIFSFVLYKCRSRIRPMHRVWNM